MFTKLKKSYYQSGAVFTLGLLASSDAHAAGDGANNFSKIASNIVESIASLPGLLSALSYMFGLVLCVLGVMKIKDHVENPTQTPMREGAIRLAVGGALFAIPIVSQAMFATVGEGQAIGPAELNKIKMGLTSGTGG
jgi:hypothetical protein